MNPSLSMSINSFSIVHYEFGGDEQGDVFCVYKKHKWIIIYEDLLLRERYNIHWSIVFAFILYWDPGWNGEGVDF